MHAELRAGRAGQFDVVADGQTISQRGGNWLTRRFGRGYPDPVAVIDSLEERLAAEDPESPPA